MPFFYGFINNTIDIIIMDVYLDQISGKYNLNKHEIHLEPLELHRNTPFVSGA